jgi:Ca2+-binding RTX toxin-like protein
VIRQGHLIAVVGAFLIGCAVLVVAGCAGVRSQAPQEEEQGHTEATASEEARCEGTRKEYAFKWGWHMTTNDIPGCPKGGLLSGTDGRDYLGGKDGDDEIHGLGANDHLLGGGGNDAEIAGGRGHDFFLTSWPQMFGGPGEDVIYGGDGNDFMSAGEDKQPDKLYCGEGMDRYEADENDYVDSSCEKKIIYPWG